MSDFALVEKWRKKSRDLMLDIPREKNGCPLTLEGAVRSLILKHPDMMRYRDQALDMLYCVLGSGLGWDNNGRVSDNQPNNWMSIPPDSSCGVWADGFGKDESLEDLVSGLSTGAERRIRSDVEERHTRLITAAISTVEEIDVRCITYSPKPMRWYPMSWYACRLCAPDNAQRDFLEGALETAALIANTPPNYLSTDYYSYDRHTHQFAKEILPILKERVALLPAPTESTGGDDANPNHTEPVVQVSEEVKDGE